MKKRCFALFLVMIFVSVFQEACGNGIQEEENAMEDMDADMDVLHAIPDDLTGGRPWIDSCVEGNVTEDTVTSPAEDFYIYANKDWIVSSSIPEGSYSLDLDIFAEARARVQAVLEGGDLSGHDVRQEDFDYRAFFETRVQKVGPTLHTPEYELMFILGGDMHPPVYLDINMTFQQFDRFLETYDVKEGDGMYLAPEDRLIIW